MGVKKAPPFWDEAFVTEERDLQRDRRTDRLFPVEFARHFDEHVVEVVAQISHRFDHVRVQLLVNISSKDDVDRTPPRIVSDIVHLVELGFADDLVRIHPHVPVGIETTAMWQRARQRLRVDDWGMWQSVVLAKHAIVELPVQQVTHWSPP